jgi:NAD-specific glutamate dehydrogenase
LEKEVADLTRTWTDLLGEKLRQVQGDVEGARIAKLYSESFGEAYKAATSFNVASKDIVNLEKLFVAASPATLWWILSTLPKTS